MFVDQNWELIDQTAEVNPGDIIQLRFKVNATWLYTRAAIALLAENAIKKDPHYELVSINYNDDPGYFWFKVRIVGTPILLLIAIIAGLSILGWKMFDSVPEIYKYNAISALSGSAEGIATIPSIVSAASEQKIGSQIQKAGIGLAIPIIAGAVLIYVYLRRK
jgi:hypothetical protein